MPAQNHNSPIRQQRWVEAINVGSYDIPPFGVVEYTESTNPVSGKNYLLVKRPTNDGLLNFAINGRLPIRATGAKRGLVTRHFPAYVAVADSPAPLQTLGTQTDSFYAATNRPGMLTIGDVAGGKARVTFGGVDPKCIGAAAADLTARSETTPGVGSFNVQRIVGGSLAATAFVVDAFHLGAAVSQAEIEYAVLFRDFHGSWWVDEIIGSPLECETGSEIPTGRTDCTLSDSFCLTTGKEVFKVTAPHDWKIERFAKDAAAAQCVSATTLDLCELACEDCFESMRFRDLVLSISNTSCSSMDAQDVSCTYYDGSAWSDLHASDDSYSGDHIGGWCAQYSATGGDCDFSVYLTYDAASSEWIYWLDCYANGQTTSATCDPFYLEIEFEGCFEITPIADGCCDNVPSVLLAELLETSGCEAVRGESFYVHYISANSQWEGSKQLTCGDTVSLTIACNSGTTYDVEFTIDKGSGSPSSESALNTVTAQCDPFAFADMTLLLPTGITGGTNCCDNGDTIRLAIGEVS